MLKKIQNIFFIVNNIEKSSKEFSLFFSRSPTFKGFSNELGIKIHNFNVGNLGVGLIDTYKDGLWSKKILDFKKDKHEGFFGFNFMSEDAKITYSDLKEKNICLGDFHKITFEDNNSNTFHSYLFSIDEDLISNLNVSISGSNRFFTENKNNSSDKMVKSINQVVINTTNLDEMINLFEKNLQIRLALDKTFKEWSGRMLFFRINGITIEVVEGDKVNNLAEYYGIGWHTDDFNSCYRSLISKGFELSEVRKGRKPGTLVSTLKNSMLGIPTILIGLEGEVF